MVFICRRVHRALLPFLPRPQVRIPVHIFTPRFTAVNFRGVHEEPFTYEDIVGRMTKRGEIPPKIAVTNMTTDYFSIRASLARTGSRGTTETPIPANVRIYDVAGASHGRGHEPGRLMPKSSGSFRCSPQFFAPHPY